MRRGYVHGYDRHERERLRDQGHTLVDLIHGGTTYPPDSHVLEVGCGTGVQTMSLARRSPDAKFMAIDRSAASLAMARRAVKAAGLTNVEFQAADLFSLPFPARSFDHVFVCFVLEHLADPERALVLLRRVLKPGGTITVVEGDHGSTFFHPPSAAARDAIACLVELQARAGGDGLIGRRLYPLIAGAGFTNVRVAPKTVYVDASRPDLVEGFTRKTFTAMIEGVRAPGVTAGLISPRRFDAGIRALRRTTRADGVFCYTFFKGIGVKGRRKERPPQRCVVPHHISREGGRNEICEQTAHWDHLPGHPVYSSGRCRPGDEAEA
jgi:SAM-dependent methyltransferase